MAKRRFRPADALTLRAPADPNLSPDARRVAFTVAEADEENDRLSTSIWVAAVDGSAPARPFSEGPGDRAPRWSPDGRWLAYLSVPNDRPEQAHVRLAPLDGGVPRRLGDLPGPVGHLAWSPDSRRIVVVCQVGVPDRETSSPRERNAPRLVRGLAARLDGVGWHEGRRHLFVIDVDDGSAIQLTRGEFDHADPSFSPDGATILFVSDRHRRRDDRLHGDAWVMPAAGGRPRRLTDGRTHVLCARFSPDGTMVAFVGRDTDAWNADNHVFVVAGAGGRPADRVAPETDRPVPLVPGVPVALAWTGQREMAALIADHGGVSLHRARLDEPRTREVIGGDLQIDGLAVVAGRPEVAFTAGWADRPAELFRSTLDGDEPVPLTHLNDEFLERVELSPVTRSTIIRPDGTEIEYFTLAPTGRAARRLPLHLEVHGGPHGAWPATRTLALHQAIAAAGYLVVLPNPRGSTGYGQEFTAACTGDWGGADYEDILACCDDLVSRGIADGRRMFVSGGSYGGFMAAWIAGHTDRFCAATAVAVVVDERSLALTTDIPEFVLFNMGGTPWDRAQEYDRRSPLSYLPDVNTPVLVIHWEGDLRTPISQGEELYTGLRLLGKEAELVRYPGGFHISRTPSQTVDWAARIVDFNERHDPRRRRRAGG